MFYLGTGTSFDIKSKSPDNYQQFTADNFIVGLTGMGYVVTAGDHGQSNESWKDQYTASATGFSVSKSSSTFLVLRQKRVT